MKYILNYLLEDLVNRITIDNSLDGIVDELRDGILEET